MNRITVADRTCNAWKAVTESGFQDARVRSLRLLLARQVMHRPLVFATSRWQRNKEKPGTHTCRIGIANTPYDTRVSCPRLHIFYTNTFRQPLAFSSSTPSTWRRHGMHGLTAPVPREAIRSRRPVSRLARALLGIKGAPAAVAAAVAAAAAAAAAEACVAAHFAAAARVTHSAAG